MPAAGCKRIALVTDEILGVTRSSGAATANTFLAFALADRGHDVEVLFAAPLGPAGAEEPWRHEYHRRGIRIQAVEPFPGAVSPRSATVTCAVYEALRHEPPDVVVADDRYGPCYAAVRARKLALGFGNTLFVIYCHGTTAWISEAHRKIRRWPAAFEVEALERMTIELADTVVSPSAYMIEWMRNRGWRLPDTVVAPLLTRSADDRRADAVACEPSAVRSLAFFGRLEERKGLTPFIDALNDMDAQQLSGLDVLFVGKETPAWSAARVRAALSPAVTSALRALRFETDLDQPEALALLKRSATLAVMPSLVDNSPMVIYECLEHGIPFLASSVGGGPELVAEDDRQRSFVEPTADALRRRLAAIVLGRQECSPSRPAFDRDHILRAWEAVIGSSAVRPERSPSARTVTAIVRRRGGPDDLDRCLRGLREQSRSPDHLLVVEPKSDAGAATGDFVFLLDDLDQPETDCVETLLRAQSAADADVVTCAFRHSDGSELVSFFLGDAQDLGAIGNYYGLAGLYRRRVFDDPSATAHSEWLRLASLSLTGHRIVSVPRPLIRSPRLAEGAARASEVALKVAGAFERAGPPQLRGLPMLAASLAARINESPAPTSLRRRASWILANEGLAELVRRPFVRSKLSRAIARAASARRHDRRGGRLTH
jgi:glycosyltransferase involved in cell wall biosynthesis